MTLDDVALTLEHEFQYGGAQRLAAIFAERIGKDLYYIGDGVHRIPCWNRKVINAVPPEKYLFSLTVDKSKPISIKGKVHIKFMHSFETIRRLNGFEAAKDFIWITHRKRVYESALDLGYDVYLIPDGFILYDHEPAFDIEKGGNLLASISRIERDNRVELAIDTAEGCGMPLCIIGTNKDHLYLEELKTRSGKEIEFLGEINETEKLAALKKSILLLHASDGKFRDYLYYSILDGLACGCVPICITPDIKQFEEINRLRIGKVVNTAAEAVSAVHEILDNYEGFKNRIENFMVKFMLDQKNMLNRYLVTIGRIIDESG